MEMISAVIITFNEEANIARCIESVAGVADEVLVVDGHSTDRTEEICRQMNARFITKTFEGHIEQKNFAMQQAIHNWVLSLDADECLSDELKKSILQVKNQLASDAYSMNRRNNFCGQWIRHSGWYPDRKVRLWNRKKGRWGGTNPHDKVVMQDGIKAQFLKGDLLHYTVTSVEQFKMQQQKFAGIAARELRKQEKGAGVISAAMRASLMFIRRYFFQLGFLDGYYGWIICSEAARYTFSKYRAAR